MRIQPVFHVSLLKLYREERGMQPPEPLLINDEAIFLLERILDHKIMKIGRKSRREYLVKWQGQAPDHNSWVPEETLINSAAHSLRTYWEAMGYDPPAHLFPPTSWLFREQHLGKSQRPNVYSAWGMIPLHWLINQYGFTGTIYTTATQWSSKCTLGTLPLLLLLHSRLSWVHMVMAW